MRYKFYKLNVMKKLFLIWAVVAIVFTGCETTGSGDIDQALVQILSGQQALNFGSDGTSRQDISFIAMYDWSVSTSDSWINVSPSSGKAGQECSVTVTLDKNETYDSRSGKVTISVQDTGFDINVTQAQKNALILSDYTIDIDPEGGAFEIEVQHNIDYTISIEEGCNWISQTSSRALTSSVIKFVASENDSNSSRSTIIAINGSDITESVTVTQNRKALNAGDNNVIFYTQAEGATSRLNIYISDTTDFGANIVSHTYENGQGEIVFDGPVTKIGGYVFKNCITLTSMTLPNSVTSIEGGAFYGCSDLASVTIPDNVTEIGQAAFYHCSSLTDITIPNGVTLIGGVAFEGCSSLTNITIPDSVTDMGTSVFDSCTALTDVTIGKGLTTIPSGTFRSCSGLRSIVIPDNIITIKGKRNSAGGSLYWFGAFQWCSNLTDITIGKGLQKIEDTAFFGVSNIKRVYISDISKWCQVSFDSSSENPLYNADELYLNNKLVTDLVLPDDITEICCFAFINYDKLKSITFPKNLTKIGDGAFSGCTALTDIIFPESLTALGDGHTASTDIADGGFSMIGGGSIQPDVWGAFYGCSSITNITIPEYVTSINGKVFADCNNLEVVHVLPTAVPTLNGSAFPITLKEIRVPSSSYIDYVSQWSGYASIIVADDVEGDTPPSSDDSDNKVIYYTTSDNNPITINVDYYWEQSCFGAKIALNSYENGQGRIIFDKPITRIGDGSFYPFKNCSTLTSITIPDSVTSIGSSAFFGCSSLTSITIPDGVTSIGGDAFYKCGGLTSINIPDSVTSIGSSAFSECRSLTSVTIGNSVKWIKNSAFYNCSRLTSINIPDSVTSIGSSAFDNCSSLTSVHISDLSAWCKISFGDYDANPLYEEGGKLYLNGNELTELTIPSDITEIKNYAFFQCSSLKSVTIPDSVTSIGGSAFSGCSSLKSVNIPDSVTSIGGSAFSGCSSLTSITIPDGVTSIGSSAFSGCSSLTSVTIPNSVTLIGKSAFSSCTGELTVNCNIPNASSSYEYGVFYNSKFTKVSIGNGVTSIGDYAFYECRSLTSVIIPDSVTSIGKETFRDCSGIQFVFYNGDLAQWCNINTFDHYSSPLNQCGTLLVNGEVLSGEITIPDGAKKIPSGTFRNNTLITKMIIPDSVSEIGAGAFSGCSSLASVHISDLSAWCKISFGNSDASPLYNGGKLYLNGNELTELTIPSDITEIKDCAFSGCSSLTCVTIPDSVTSIGWGAFKSCRSLTSVTIPDSVTSIGKYAFSGCSSLTSITIPDGVTSIGEYAFFGCSSLTSITIPDGVTSIGEYAFNGCSSLTSVTIPDSVTSIGEYAFYRCSRLTSATIGNSVTSIGSYAFYYCSSLTSVYCKPTNPPKLRSTTFSSSYIKKIYVPTSATNLYKISSGWSSYADKIEGYDFSAEQ